MYVGDDDSDAFQQLHFPSSVVKQTFLGVCHACVLLVPKLPQVSPLCQSNSSECRLPAERGTIRCWGNNRFHELGKKIEQLRTQENIIGDGLTETPDTFPELVSDASQIKCDTPLQKDAQPRVGCECPAGYSRRGSSPGCTLDKSPCTEGSCLYGRRCTSTAPKVNRYGVMMPSNYSCDCVRDADNNPSDVDLSGSRCEIDTKLPQMLSKVTDANGDIKEWCRDHNDNSPITIAKIKISDIQDNFKVLDKSTPSNPVWVWKASMLENPDYWNFYCRKTNPAREIQFLTVLEATQCENIKNRVGEAISYEPYERYFISDNTRNELSTGPNNAGQNKLLSKGIRSVRVCSTDACCTESDAFAAGQVHHLYFCITDLSGNLLKRFCNVEIVD